MTITPIYCNTTAYLTLATTTSIPNHCRSTCSTKPLTASIFVKSQTQVKIFSFPCSVANSFPAFFNCSRLLDEITTLAPSCKKVLLFQGLCRVMLLLLIHVYFLSLNPLFICGLTPNSYQHKFTRPS